jgi:hypothetical protein
MVSPTSFFNPSDLNPATSYGVQLDTSPLDFQRVPTSSIQRNEPDQLSTSTTGVGNHFVLHWNNPLFWLLLLVLLFVGYVGFLFDFSVKRIGKVDISGGKR